MVSGPFGAGAHSSFPIPSFPRAQSSPKGTCLGVTGKPQAPPLPRAPPTTASLPVAEIGVGITGFGAFFILLGVLLYFDSVLLAFGNVSAPALWTLPTSLRSLLLGSALSSFPCGRPGSGASSLGRQGGWGWTAGPVGQGVRGPGFSGQLWVRPGGVRHCPSTGLPPARGGGVPRTHTPGDGGRGAAKSP